MQTPHFFTLAMVIPWDKENR